MRGIVLLKNGNSAIVASHVDASQAGVEGDHVAAFRLRKIGDGLMSIQPEDRHEIVFLAGEKSQAVLAVKRHAMISLTFPYRVLGNLFVGGRIDFSDHVLVL